jgi:hypothetical protein
LGNDHLSAVYSAWSIHSLLHQIICKWAYRNDKRQQEQITLSYEIEIIGEISSQEVEGGKKMISKNSKNISTCHPSPDYYIPNHNILYYSHTFLESTLKYLSINIYIVLSIPQTTAQIGE